MTLLLSLKAHAAKFLAGAGVILVALGAAYFKGRKDSSRNTEVKSLRKTKEQTDKGRAGAQRATEKMSSGEATPAQIVAENDSKWK